MEVSGYTVPSRRWEKRWKDSFRFRMLDRFAGFSDGNSRGDRHLYKLITTKDN